MSHDPDLDLDILTARQLRTLASRIGVSQRGSNDVLRHQIRRSQLPNRSRSRSRDRDKPPPIEEQEEPEEHQITVHDAGIDTPSFIIHLPLNDPSTLTTYVRALDSHFGITSTGTRLPLAIQAQNMYNFLLEQQPPINSIKFSVNAPCANLLQGTTGAEAKAIASVIIEEAGLKYCLTPEDINFINTYERNPYTGRAFTFNKSLKYQDIATACGGERTSYNGPTNPEHELPILKDPIHETTEIYSQRGFKRLRNHPVGRIYPAASEELAREKFCDSRTVYRGLGFPTKDFPPELAFLTPGAKFEYACTQVRSWTYSLDVASLYAYLKSDNPHMHRIILKCTFRPDDILVDSTVSGASSILSRLEEVRSRPGVYQVEVHTYLPAI